MAKIKVTYNTLSVRWRKSGGVGGVGCLSLTSSIQTARGSYYLFWSVSEFGFSRSGP